MSIVIQNISEKYGQGEQDYELRINRKVIARFKHVFADGLGECLRKAAAAADDPNRLEVQLENELLMETFHALSEYRTKGS